MIAANVFCSQAQAEQANSAPIAAITPTRSIANIVAEASQRFSIPVAWNRAVVDMESAGNPHAVSPKGAIGLMQIMPDAWAYLQARYHLGSDPYDAHDNMVAGAAYLRELYDRYGIAGFLAAYNTGTARWEEHLASGKPLPSETRHYLLRLKPIIDVTPRDITTSFAVVASSWTGAPLFPALSPPSENDKSITSNVATDRPSNDGAATATAVRTPRSERLFVTLSSGSRAR